MPKFDVEKKRKRINVLKFGKIYLFKYFYDHREIFKGLADFYNSETYRFEMKSVGVRNKVMKFLEIEGQFENYIIEDPSDFMVMIDKDKKYGDILKNSVDHRITRDARIFIMKDMAAVEEAMSLGAEKYNG